MARVMARALQVRAIKADLVRNGYDPETVDVNALVDGTLSLPENRKNIAQKLRYKLGKKLSRRESKKKANVDYCESLRHQCEIKGDTQSCREYGRDNCSSVTGKIEGCRTCGGSRAGRQTKAKKTNAVLRDGQCMIPVKSYYRRCSPKTAANMSAARGR